MNGEESVTGILDGQQRFASLYLGLKGTYAMKLDWKRWDNIEAFPRRKLYLNLLAEAKENEYGMIYDFRLLTEEEAQKVGFRSGFWYHRMKAEPWELAISFYTIFPIMSNTSILNDFRYCFFRCSPNLSSYICRSTNFYTICSL